MQPLGQRHILQGSKTIALLIAIVSQVSSNEFKEVPLIKKQFDLLLVRKNVFPYGCQYTTK